MMFSLNDHSHRRQNILTGEWVHVSPHRAKRPWQGQVERVEEEKRPEYDPECYLCPGNVRAGGEVNPDYKQVFSFTNDFAALQPDIPQVLEDEGFFRFKSERGTCRVICFSPRHDLTIPEMEVEAIAKVVELWIAECKELGGLDYINNIQLFENKGSVMGCSNPHPHGQIWAQESIPVEIEKKQGRQKEYYQEHKSTLLSGYLIREVEEQSRILFRNKHFTVLVPFWATWPFETMIIPHRPMQRITEMKEEEMVELAEAYKWITVKYDNLFEVSFPYSAGIHQAPFDGLDHPEWHWHMLFYPPLLRSATVKKFMVGYEMLANPQRDFTAEQAAERLRNLPQTHYKLNLNLKE